MRVAAVQFNPRILEKKDNLEKILSYIQECYKNESQLVVFPECSLTGYCLSSREETASVAESIPGESSRRVADICKKLKISVVLGMVEENSGAYYNVAVFIEPGGLIQTYRKVHLPHQGLDRFVTNGDQSFPVYSLEEGNIGLIVCYDSFFPESSRILSLKGADLIALPTNWAKGVEFYYKYIIPSRAIENRVNFVAVNRVGRERNFEFYGNSKIIAFDGRIIAEGSDKEEVIYGDIDLEGAKNKHVIRIPGEWEVDILQDRRPNLYSKIIE